MGVRGKCIGLPAPANFTESQGESKKVSQRKHFSVSLCDFLCGTLGKAFFHSETLPVCATQEVVLWEGSHVPHRLTAKGFSSRRMCER